MNLMRWDYKVISIDKLFQGSEDHDIAVSMEAATARRSKVGQGMENTLNELGEESWELVSLAGDFGIFKKPKN
ncbi:MAG: hypothetical protein A3J42_06335 [Candidatus Dadabacteria bacterium RIFCSPHIGHO2_12_FULL_53_21]|nr:MAG: hypothetical protein A3J42_06335 [Candidatus Dadabacteria bacterium RIFCSPHIGHO2_12_FULL_53_21]